MENLFRPIYQEFASDINTVGIIAIEKKQFDIPITNNFEMVLVVIVDKQEEITRVKQYEIENNRLMLYSLAIEQVLDSLLYSSNKKVFEWLHFGKIIFDRNETVSRLKTRFMEYPKERRELKMNIEFAKLIKRYKNGKVLFEQGQFLDAYNSIIHSLHHLGRLAIIEKGFHPEITVWKQVKNIDNQILKLYEELVFSKEDLPKRLELLFIASDFLIYSKQKTCLKHFFDIFSEKERWSAIDIYNHPEIQPYVIDLDTLLEYLIEKKVLCFDKEVSKNERIEKLFYKILK